MKCPECGFDCLPDDVECLACGIDIAAAAENKEKERIRSIEAAERKAKYDIKMKKELGLVPDEGEKPAPKTGNTLEETFKKKLTCPKCGAERHPDAKDCLRCGIIFDRLEGKKSSEDASPREVVPANGNQPSALQTQPANAGQTLPPEDRTKEIDLKDLVMVDESKKTAPEAFVQTEPPVEEIAVAKPESMDSQVKTQDQSRQETETPPTSESPVNVETAMKPAAPEKGVVNDLSPAPSIADNEKTEIINIDQFKPRIKTPPPQITFKEKLRKNMSGTYQRLEPGLRKTGANVKAFFKSKRNLTVLGAIALVLVLAFTAKYGVSYYEKAKEERIKREYAEKLEKIRLDFVTRKDDINNKIRALILSRLFEDAGKEIALYDIPSLQNDLKPLKNFMKEMILFEKAKTIPVNEFENNYRAFLELHAMAPDNELYLTKSNLYKKKFADREYGKAKAYLSGKSKNVDELGKALSNINQSLELFPDSKEYNAVKVKLLTEQLLYYEGNENILMAVRDDGMGKKLLSNQRKLTIWLKNISNETVYVNVQYFTMVGNDNKRYTYNDMGKKLSSKLEPGEESVGELYFRTKARPKKLIFNHLIKGQISRVFP